MSSSQNKNEAILTRFKVALVENDEEYLNSTECGIATALLREELLRYAGYRKRASWNEEDLDQIVSEGITKTLEYIAAGGHVTNLLLSAKSFTNASMADYTTCFQEMDRKRRDGIRPRDVYLNYQFDKPKSNLRSTVAGGWMQPELEFLKAEQSNVLQNVWDQIPDREQHFIRQHTIQDVSQIDIASSLDIKANSVSRAIKRALKKSRAQFELDYD